MEAIYLYGLIEADKERSFGPIGLGGCEVSTLHHRDLAAVVSPSPLVSFDGLTKEALLHYLFAHQSVVEKVMAEGYTVVPVKFGTVAPDVEEARRIVKEGYPHLKGALLAIRGRRELDVVALWSDLQAILREIGEEEEIKRFKVAIASRPPQETLEERIQIGRMVKAALEEKRDGLAAELLEALKGPAAHVRCHDLLDDSMIMNVAFLMDKGREKEFDRTLNQLGDRYDGRVHFRCIGPLAPYSFSTVEVKRIPVEAVERARRFLGVDEGASLASVKKAYRRAAHRYHPDKVRSIPAPPLKSPPSPLYKIPPFPPFVKGGCWGDFWQRGGLGGGGLLGVDEGFQELKEAYQLLVDVGEGLTPSCRTGRNQSCPYGSDLIIIKVG